MAAVTPRIIRTNLVTQSTSALTASSSQSGFDVQLLLDQARGRRWRSATGWTVVPGFNDELLFSTNDGARIGHVAPGTYATGATYATAVQTAFGVSGYNPRTAMSSALKAWFRADSVVVDSSGLIQTWTDLSGNGNDATQGSAGNRATWTASATGGRPAGYWDGTNNAMRYNTTTILSSLLASDGQGTVVTVYYLDSDAAASDVLWCATAGGSTIYAGAYWGGGTSFVSALTDSASAAKTATKASGAVAQWQHHWWEYDKTNIQSYSNDADTAAVANTASTNNINATGLAGVLSIGTDTANATKGYIAEIMVFNRALTETERRGITEYIKGRYPTVAANDATTVTGWGVTLGATYDSSAHKFTISRTGGAGNISLLGNSGVPAANLQAQALPDLGMSIAADKTGATSYLADTAAYQSRHWLKVDLGAVTATTVGALVDDNGGASRTLTQYGNDINLWVSPTTTKAITVDSAASDITYSYWSTVSQRWWRLLISDITNSTGYAEVGVWFTGVAVNPTAGYIADFTPNYADLTQVNYGVYGALRVDERPQRGEWKLKWSPIKQADYDLFVTFRKTTPIGRCFFFAFDTTVDTTNIVYGELSQPLNMPHFSDPTALWVVEMSLREALA